MSITASFKDRTVLVTGGAQGIGLSIVKKFYEAEASVFILDQDEGKLAEVKALLPNVTTVQVNLKEWGKVQKVIESLGPIHHLVNNAGVGRPAETFTEIKMESIDELFDINFKALINVSQTVAKMMISHKLENATIVNMSSISDSVAVPGIAMYSCSKAAVTMLTKCMALELGTLANIRVNCVRPALVKTERLGQLSGNKSEVYSSVLKVNERKVIKRLVEMNDVADAVLFLSSSASSMISGSDLLLDGGLFTC